MSLIRMGLNRDFCLFREFSVCLIIHEGTKMTLQELESNQKFRYWYDYIIPQQASGLAVSVFYAYKRKIKQLIFDDINSRNETSAVVPFVAVSGNIQAELSDSVLITRGTVRIELDEDISYQDVEKLPRSLIC